MTPPGGAATIRAHGFERTDAGLFYTPNFARSPLTLLVFGMVAGYCAMYAAGLLRWRRRAAAAR